MNSITYKLLACVIGLLCTVQSCLSMENQSLGSTSQRAAIYNIKGICDYVRADYKHLSLIHGAIAWEVGFVRKLYDFGEIAFTTSKDQSNRTVIKSYDVGGHDMVRLVHAFFSRVPGSTSDTDFAETKKLAKNISDEKLLEACAQIIASCDHVRKNIVAINDYLVAFAKSLPSLGMRDHILALIDPAEREDAVLRQAADMVKFAGKELTKENVKEAAKTIRMEVSKTFKQAPLTQLKNIASNLKSCEGTLKLVLGDIALNSMKLNGKIKVTSVLLGAVIESFVGKSALYVPYTAEMILLAFVYKKYGQHKEKIKLFYEKLHVLLEEKFLEKALPNNWQDECYASVFARDAKNNVELLSKTMPSYDKLEDLVFYSTQCESYPRSNSYSTVSYEYEELLGKNAFFEKSQLVKTTFSDCMDNTIRNFIRLLAYDPQEKYFSCEMLKKRGFVNISESLKLFLYNYQFPQSDASRQAHDDWIKVISNKDYVMYVTTAKQGTFFSVGQDKLAFMKLPSETKIIFDTELDVNDRIDFVSNGCELLPCVRNIIVLLDYLLGLQLFEFESIEKAIVRKDFIKEYFPRLCIKLGCKSSFLATTKSMSMQLESLDLFDNRDLLIDIDGDKKIYSTLVFEQFACQFMTHSPHGELYYDAPSSEPIFTFSNQMNFDGMPGLSLLTTFLVNYSKINDISFLPSELVYSNIFALPLENHDLCSDLIAKIKYIKSEAVIRLLMRSIDKQADRYQAERLKFELVRDMITGGGAVIACYALPIALKKYKSYGQAEALTLLTKIVQEGYGFDEALEVAVDALYKQHQLEDWAIPVLEVLCKQKHEKTIKTLIEAAKKDILEDYSRGYRLFGCLLQSGYGVDEAIALAVAMGKKVKMRRNAYDLFKLIIRYDYGFDEAIAYAKRRFINDVNNYDDRKRACWFFEDIAKYKKAYSIVVDVVTKLCSNSSYDVRNQAGYLLEELKKSEFYKK